ncbi:hypothetical protein [Pseudomonas sp. G5(2012)]|uniref:hypothetical protein n=1 Tax=Pseudomonas sp. G5(2012) TaxID=1268068 RepID=UPI00210948D6|nr:hypothetical protein [Pseudomonas sp. G5(2012)]
MALAQSPEEKPGRDSSAAGPKPIGGGRKNRVVAMREQKQQRFEELRQDLKELLPQLIQTKKRVGVTYNVMQKKTNDPSCSEQERAKFKQLYLTELHAQRAGDVTMLGFIEEMTGLRPDSFAAQTRCDLLEQLINNARAQITIKSLDIDAAKCNYTHSNSDEVQLATALLTEGTVVVDGFLEYMGELCEIYETLIKLHTEVGSRLRQLQGMSHHGAEAWERLTSNRPDNDASVLGTKVCQLTTLTSLGAKEPGSDTSAALLDVMAPLQLLFSSYIELQISKHYKSDDRIAVLDNLVKHYDTAMVGLTSIGILRSDELQPDRFAHLCEIVGQLRDDAELRLADELKSAETPSPTSKAELPATSPSRKRVIHTVKGTLIGEVRARVANQGTNIVDVRSPFEDQPLASFREDKSNAWVEIVEASKTAPKARVTPYPQLKGDARKALAKIDELVHKFEGYARGASHPKGIEESLQNTAQYLIDYADRLERHENAPSNSQKDADLVKDLRLTAGTIKEKATQLRIQISLAQAPTSEAVEYLFRHKEVHPQKIGERIQLKTGRQDFLQEYVLMNNNNRPLWYAHFHYKTSSDANADYTAASLKTKDQRFETNATALAKAQNAHQKIDIYRGHIDKELATKIFSLP